MVQVSYGTAVVVEEVVGGSRAAHFSSRKRIAPLLLSGLFGLAVATACLVGYAALRQSHQEAELLTYDEKNQGMPNWAHPALPSVDDRSSVNGRWTSTSTFAPYVSEMTMYSGEGVDRDGSANYVRRLLGIKRQWRFHHWNTNNFVRSFESNQMRFLSRNKNSFLIIPSLSEMPVLSGTAARLLNNYLLYGHNTLIVCGSPSSVLFINENLPSWDFHGYDLSASWHSGPYEQQKTTIGSRFDKTAEILVGPNVWGVAVNSLPKEAVSYYEAPGVSVVFALPAKTGVIIYIGYEFNEENAAWAEVLQAAVRGTAL